MPLFDSEKKRNHSVSEVMAPQKIKARGVLPQMLLHSGQRLSLSVG